jgi:ElaA protein
VSEYDVRVAAVGELDVRTSYLLWQLRESVFVVEQQCPYPELDGRDLEPTTRHVWVAVVGPDGEQPVAYLRVLDDGDVFRVGRVLVAAAHRGGGLAGVLMSRAHELCAGRPVVLDAQSYLVDFYTGLGYQVTGPEFLDDGIPHLPMRRAVRE